MEVARVEGETAVVEKAAAGWAAAAAVAMAAVVMAATVAVAMAAVAKAAVATSPRCRVITPAEWATLRHAVPRTTGVPEPYLSQGRLGALHTK